MIKNLTLILVMFVLGLDISAQYSKDLVDNYVVYPGLHIGMTNVEVSQMFDPAVIHISDDNNFPHSKLLDTNLYDEITIDIPKIDSINYPTNGEPYIQLRFYQGKVYSIHYSFTVNKKSFSWSVIEMLSKSFGGIGTSKYYNKRQMIPFDRYAIWYTTKYTWKGSKYLVEFLDEYRGDNEYIIEICQRDEQGYQNYLKAWEAVKTQHDLKKKNKSKQVAIKGGNADVGQILKDFISATVNSEKLSVMEKSLPACQRTCKIVYEKRVDQNGVFYGLYDFKKIKHKEYSYTIEKGQDYFIDGAFIVATPEDKVLGVIVHFSEPHDPKNLEKLFEGSDIVFSKEKENQLEYKDLLGQIKIISLLEGSYSKKVGSWMVVQKHAQQYFD